MITGRQDKIEPQVCRNWAIRSLASGASIYVPEIADYEVRRELIRSGKIAGIQRLDDLLSLAIYLPLNTQVMRVAAELWAQSRNSGMATSDPAALDGDVIVAAQALSLKLEVEEFVVASENVRHLSRFVTAKRWQDINL